MGQIFFGQKHVFGPWEPIKCVFGPKNFFLQKIFLKKFPKFSGPAPARGGPPPKGVQDWSMTASEPSQTVGHPAKRWKKVFKRKKSTPVALFMANIPFWGGSGGFSGSRRPQKRLSPREIFCYECVGNDLKTTLVQIFSKKSTPSPRYGHFGDFSRSGGAGSIPTGRIIKNWGPAVNCFQNLFFCKKTFRF